MSEEILGRIEAGYPALDVHHADDVLNLVFTSNRIIVARMISGSSLLIGYGTGRITKRDVEEKKKEMREFYGKLSPEGILKADEKNYAIPYAEVTKVEMKKPGIFGGGKMKLYTSSKIHEFVFKEKKELFDERVNLVRSILPDKLSLT